MAVVLKITAPDPSELERGSLIRTTMIRKDDPDVELGGPAFVWSHYSAPNERDGHLCAVGVVVGFERSNDRKSAWVNLTLSSRQPTTIWRTEALGPLKKLSDGSPQTEIADEVRGFTHDHIGHVSRTAAAFMAAHFA